MVFALAVLAVALALLVPFSAYLWRSRAKERKATLAAVILARNAVNENLEYVHQLKGETAVAFERKEREIQQRDATVKEHQNERSALQTEVSLLKLDIASKEGSIAALHEHFKETGARLVAIEAGHNFHIGGATTGHDGSHHILYECECGVRISGVEGFVKVGTTNGN